MLPGWLVVAAVVTLLRHKLVAVAARLAVCRQLTPMVVWCQLVGHSVALHAAC